jgi:uncharacterized protein (TIRG00374 family)
VGLREISKQMTGGNKQNNNRPVSIKRHLFTIRSLVSGLVALGALVLLFTRFDIELGSALSNIRQSNPVWFAAGFFVHYLGFVARGWRWRILLNNVWDKEAHTAPPPTLWVCIKFVFLGSFANCVLGLRIGDAYRAYLISGSNLNNASRSMGTVLAERVLDMTLVFLLLAGTALWVSSQGSLGLARVFVVASFVLGLLGVLGVLAMWLFGLKLAQFLPRKMEQLYVRLHDGTLGSFQRIPWLIVLGVLAWMCEMGRLYCVIQALGHELAVPMIVFVALANALLTTIPITPGGVGLVEPGIVGLLVLRFTRESASSIALLDRSISYLSIVLLGGSFFFCREVVAWWLDRTREKQE